MIEELHRFILAAKEGNITKTAEKIFITQSALSQSIKRLESELGTKLFMQTGKQLQLTPDGEMVLTIGSKILQLWQNAKNPEIRKTARQTIAIGSFDNAALRLGKYVQDTISADTYTLELSINASGLLLKQLQWGIVDLAICVVNKSDTLHKSIVLIETFREELIPVTKKSFKGPLSHIPFILYNKGSHTRNQIDYTFQAKGIQPTIFAESTSTTFMKELAILGSGVALLPANFVASELAQNVLIKQKLPFRVEREYGLYIHNQSTLTKDHTIVKEICSILKS